ncbi:ubiquitin- hect domain protein, putative [Ichthyophthirius multifiliis]|uniref:HECT-type E3 ubiquitin transferase n=1 Tax=Ichthyophthirius multifiliis TaxID=5932 RepID=G0R035_ICHMU|nr:ubiquitin- hect domain protein, putative [Ichthyophthirius multifiliis]EGR29168.1 ubiquitin- hect domain protein, putative [Ichthyophthirius multifiliis]|eukprot:XP_004030404.1 ubiquitin- hect domain protein, putative [Ichthyophthirius multifiliis]
MQPSPNSIIIVDYLLHFQMAGRLIAKTLIDDFTCEVDFTKSFLKQILGQPLYINDLEDIDPQMAKGLMDILQNSVEELYLDFTYTINQFGEQKVIELIPNGSNIEVTEENKKNYVKELAYFRMVKQIETQVQAFKKGFYEVIPLEYIKIVSVRELGHRLSGNHIIDINDMKKIWFLKMDINKIQIKLNGYLKFQRNMIKNKGQDFYSLLLDHLKFLLVVFRTQKLLLLKLIVISYLYLFLILVFKNQVFKNYMYFI